MRVRSWSGTRYHSVFFHLLDCKHMSFVPSIQCFVSLHFSTPYWWLFYLKRSLSTEMKNYLSVTHHKKMVFHAENICDKLRLDMSYIVLLAMSSTLMNQWYLVHKVSLKRNPHKTELCIGWLTNDMTRGSQEPNSYFP